MSLNGKVAIITGASAGIGAATAEIFAKQGAHVVLVGRNLENLILAEKKCKLANSNAQTLAVQADVTLDSEKIINETIRRFKRLDILVNNAGIFKVATFMESNVQDLDALWQTNLRSVHVLTKLAAPYLFKTQGNIVNVSSIAGLRSYPGFANYCLTKAALDQFTKCLSLEFAPHNVRVNSVNPGVIDTAIFSKAGMTAQHQSEFMQEQMKVHPLGRFGQVYEVANVIAFLSSNEASFITGALLPIDGGRVVSSP